MPVPATRIRGTRPIPYLLRTSIVDRPDQAGCADITFVPVKRESRDLVAILDRAARKAWCCRLSNTQPVGFCIEGMQDATDRFSPPEIMNTGSGRPVHRRSLVKNPDSRPLVGIGGEPASTMYFVDPDHWGKGHATEAMRCILAHVVERFELDPISAGANADTPASGRVLQKLGFAETRPQDQRSGTRLEPDTVIMYRLSRTRWKANT